MRDQIVKLLSVLIIKSKMGGVTIQRYQLSVLQNLNQHATD